jgi:hypothetical protein
MQINKFLLDASFSRAPRRIKSKVAILGLALTFTSASYAAFGPLPITSGSYNADVVVEKSATPVLTVVTTASVDNGTNNTANTWMEVGFDPANPTNGLPAPNTVITAISNPNYTFKMPPTYTGPNGILIDTVVSNGTFTLTTPASYTLLSFLGSGGNGGDVIAVKVHHADATVEVGSFGCPDWFNGTVNVAYYPNERVTSTTAFGYNPNTLNPRIYFRDIPLTNASPVTSIDLTYSSGLASSHNDILAVSGAATAGGLVAPITVTGYTYDFVVEAGAAKSGPVHGTNGLTAATFTMDNSTTNIGASWYEKGFNINNFAGSPNPSPLNDETGTGIPPAGSTFTNAAADHVYTMPPDYTVNNAVWLAPTPAMSNATITLVTPAAVSALSFLAAAGNGPATPMVAIHHQDGTTETNTITVPDWFNNSAPFAYGANGRVGVDTAQFDVRNDANKDPRLFPCDVSLANTVSPVTSIDVLYTNTGGRISILAVSGTAGAVAPFFISNPASVAGNSGDTLQLFGGASGTAPISYFWQKGTNGVFVNLANGGTVSGATTTNVTLTGVTLADGADYRLIASNVAGSATSAVATVTVLSPLQDITQPGDPITAFGVNLFGDGAPANAIDNNLGTKFGANVSGPCGMVITPNAGSTIVSGARFYTANDSTGRDPADYKLEGSINSGATWTLISSNSLALPDGRNTAGSPDPLNQFMQEVDFNNTIAYTSYRVTFSHYKGGAGQTSCQLGELELLGTLDTSGCPSVTPPGAARAYAGTSATLTATVTGNPTPTDQWQKKTGGVFVNLVDNSNISGSQTPSLTINSVGAGDATDYRLIVANTCKTLTSSVVTLTIVSSLTDVTQPSDVVTDFGNAAGAPASNPAASIDDTFTAYTITGHGLNAEANFPPFGGPVGLVITPAIGSTRVNGIRFYPGANSSDNDPADYLLEGSNNGTTFTTIASGSLALPQARNDVALAVDPLTSSMQEIDFANNNTYTIYRVTFNHVNNDNTVSNLQLGELELLGGTVPVVTISASGGGTLTITSSQPGTLLSATNLLSTGTVWTSEGPISGSVVITPAAGVPQKFYRVSVP